MLWNNPQAMWHTCEDKHEARESLGAWLLTVLLLSTVKALATGGCKDPGGFLPEVAGCAKERA